MIEDFKMLIEMIENSIDFMDERADGAVPPELSKKYEIAANCLIFARGFFQTVDEQTMKDELFHFNIAQIISDRIDVDMFDKKFKLEDLI